MMYVTNMVKGEMAEKVVLAPRWVCATSRRKSFQRVGQAPHEVVDVLRADVKVPPAFLDGRN